MGLLWKGKPPGVRVCKLNEQFMGWILKCSSTFTNLSFTCTLYPQLSKGGFNTSKFETKESGLSLRARQVPPSKAGSSKCYIPNSDFYCLITFPCSHLPFFSKQFPLCPFLSPVHFSLQALPSRSAAYLELNFHITKATSSEAVTQCCCTNFTVLGTEARVWSQTSCWKTPADLCGFPFSVPMKALG